jgi:hypothetical protein
MAQVVPQVKQPSQARGGDGLEVHLPEGELRPMRVEQAEFRR